MPHLSSLPLLSNGMLNQGEKAGLQGSLSGNGTNSQSGGFSPYGPSAHLTPGREKEVSIPSSLQWFGALEGEGGLPLFRAGSE